MDYMSAAPTAPDTEEESDYDRGLVEHFILFTLLENPIRTVREISNKMLELVLPFRRGKTSVSKIIRRLNIRVGLSIKRPRLTYQQMSNRERFAAEVRQEERYNIPWFFSDECMIDLNPYRKRVYYLPGIRTAEKIYQDYCKHPIHVMVWGGIAKNYKSPLLCVIGYMNAEKYIQMLTESGVIENLDIEHGPMRWLFQDDGAPPHRAKKTKEFLNNRCLNLASGNLYWPANSPDLNPQEKMWAILRQQTILEGCSSPEELFNRLVTTWNSIPMDTVNHLVDSFSVSLCVVEALDGGCINGHRNIAKQINSGEQTAYQVKYALQEERMKIENFLEYSRDLFVTNPQHSIYHSNYKKYVRDSCDIVRQLPKETLRATRILKTYPDHE